MLFALLITGDPVKGIFPDSLHGLFYPINPSKNSTKITTAAPSIAFPDISQLYGLVYRFTVRVCININNIVSDIKRQNTFI
jgi:hypothetical protein